MFSRRYNRFMVHFIAHSTAKRYSPAQIANQLLAYKQPELRPTHRSYQNWHVDNSHDPNIRNPNAVVPAFVVYIRKLVERFVVRGNAQKGRASYEADVNYYAAQVIAILLNEQLPRGVRIRGM